MKNIRGSFPTAAIAAVVLPLLILTIDMLMVIVVGHIALSVGSVAGFKPLIPGRTSII